MAISAVIRKYGEQAAESVGRGGDSGFPLAKGEEARIMRLRGYGDGIVAPVAAAFIKSYMETLA